MQTPPMIGKNIQRIRSARKLTLNVLSERSGVSKAMLSQIESDKVNPTVATVWKIARPTSSSTTCLKPMMSRSGSSPTRRQELEAREEEEWHHDPCPQPTLHGGGAEMKVTSSRMPP